MTDRPPMDDDLVQAYARAQALGDGAGGPAASVRANVLAAARAVAAAQAAPAAEVRAPVAPVAGPVADVARGRGDAPNLSSWRVRSGAAVFALLVVGLGLWRFDASRRVGGVQVAAADAAIEAKTLQEPAPPMGEPRELPPPRDNLPPPPRYVPPAVVADVAEPTVVLVPPAPLARERDKEAVVAQADTATRAPATGYRPPSALAAPAPAAAPPTQVAMAPAPAPAAVDDDARLAKAAAKPAAPMPAAAPAVPLPAASYAESTVALAGRGTPRRADIGGGPGANATAGMASRQPVREAPVAMASAMGGNPRPPGALLREAASAGDLDALRRLLADPAARVDAPDDAGRTALMAAVQARQGAAVRVLLAAGADPDRADASGATPRSLARTGSSAEIAALLGVPR